MKEIVTTITKKGQVTIPIEIRHMLGFKAKDKVAFRIDGNDVRLASAKYNLESAFGAVKPLNRPEDFKKIKQKVIEEHAIKVMEEMEK